MLRVFDLGVAGSKCSEPHAEPCGVCANHKLSHMTRMATEHAHILSSSISCGRC